MHKFEIAATDNLFGASGIKVCAPDGETITLIEQTDNRQSWKGRDLSNKMAIWGLYSSVSQLADAGPTSDLLRFMAYQEDHTEGTMQQFFTTQNSGANTLDAVKKGSVPNALEGADHCIT